MHLSNILDGMDVIEVNLRPGRGTKPRALIGTPCKLSSIGADWFAEIRTQGIEDVVDVTDHRQPDGGSQLAVVFSLNPDIAGAEELALQYLNRYLDHVRAELTNLSEAPQTIAHDDPSSPDDEAVVAPTALAHLIDTSDRPTVDLRSCLALSGSECSPGILGQEYGDRSYD